MNFFKFNISKREAVSESSSPQEEVKGGQYENNTVRVTSPEGALKISAYYRGVELRARTMSQLVCQFQKKSKSGGNYIEDSYGDNGALNWLLQIRPNPLMTATDLLKNLEISVIQQGNGVIYIERGLTGTVSALWLCNTASYNIGDDTYTITFYRPGGYSLLTVPSSEVLHIRNTFSWDGGVSGVSTLNYMRNILTLDATNTKLQTDTASKGGKVKLLIQEVQSPQQGVLSRANQKEVKKITERLNQEIYQKDVVMLNNIAGVTPISMTANDMDILNSRRFTVEDVSRFLAVPKILLGDGSNSSYKSPEAAMQDFLLHTIQPNILALEDELNSKILGPYDYGKHRIHVCDTNLRRLDPMAQANLNKLKIEMGVATVNDVRKDYDMPSVENGDKVYISAQWAELGSEKLRGAQDIGILPSDGLATEKGEGV